jgi:hypothetical protein
MKATTDQDRFPLETTVDDVSWQAKGSFDICQNRWAELALIEKAMQHQRHSSSKVNAKK